MGFWQHTTLMLLLAALSLVGVMERILRDESEASMGAMVYLVEHASRKVSNFLNEAQET